MVASLIGYFIAATARCRGQAGQGRIGGDQGQVADIRGVVKAVSVLLVSKLSIFLGCTRVDGSSLCVYLSFSGCFQSGVGLPGVGQHIFVRYNSRLQD